MNTYSITKFFTLVSFMLVTGFANSAPTKSTQSKQQCVANIIRTCKQTCTLPDPQAKQACISNCANEDTSECDELTDSSDNKEKCEQAFKDYKEIKDDAVRACKPFAATGASTSRSSDDDKKKCEDKLAECQTLMQDTSSAAPETQHRYSQNYELIKGIILGEDPNLLGEFGKNAPGAGCFKPFSSKAAKDARKDFRERRKDLDKEKKDIEDQAIKDKEENDKEITELTKKAQELQRENKKTLADADVRTREQLTQAQKDLVDAGSRIRALNKQITEANDSVRSKTFAFNESLQEISTSKVTLKCKEVLNTAKECIIKNTKGGGGGETCKNFPSLRSKGSKATAELRKQLQTVNDLCYEQAGRQKKQAQFQHQEEIKKSNDKVTELQAQLRDESQRQQIQSQDSQKIMQEAEREKQEAQANMAEQISTLQSEMAKLAENLALKIQKSNERLAALQRQVAELEVEEKTGDESATSMAMEAVSKGEAAIKEVASFCGCDQGGVRERNPAKAASTAVGSAKTTCEALVRTLPAGGGEKKRGKDTKSDSVL